MIEQHSTTSFAASREVHIHPVCEADIDAVYAAVEESRAEVSRFMGWCTPNYDRAAAAAWVKHGVAAWQSKSEYAFIIKSDAGQVLGTCGLNRIEPQSGTANLGYWVRTSATSRGVCTAAVAQLRAFAFEQAGLFRLEIVAAVENIGSQRVAEKSGAIREGVLRQRLFAAGIRYDSVLYSILKTDNHEIRSKNSRER